MPHEPFDSDAYERRSREGRCLVCLFAAGDPVQRADNELIYEDDEVLVFLDRYPTVEGYVLVCPRKHVEQVTGDLTEDEYAALQRWVYRVGEAIRRTLATERLYVVSLGSQQGNRHVHWHVLPLPRHDQRRRWVRTIAVGARGLMPSLHRRPPRLRYGALRALRLLELCPFVPVDVFGNLAGLKSPSSAYQQLARLRRCGLAEVRSVHPGYLIGGRRLGCWTITDRGTRMLGLTSQGRPEVELERVQRSTHCAHSGRTRSRVAESDLALLLAAYRLLAAMVLERAAQGQTAEVLEWEWPCVMAQPVPAEAPIRVKAGARVVLGAGGLAAKSDGAGGRSSQLLLVADLGTVPVLRYRRLLDVLASLRDAGESALVESFAELEIVVATADPDGTGRRPSAWRELTDRIERAHATGLSTPAWSRGRG